MDNTQWHDCRAPFIPRRTVDGGWTSYVGRTQRRWREGKWEYRQEEQDFDDWAADQW